MAAQAQAAPFYPAISGSKVLVKAGETKIPGDSVGGIESTVRSVEALYGWIISESTGTAPANRLGSNFGRMESSYFRNGYYE